MSQDSGETEDYTITGNVLTFVDAPFDGSKIRCTYRPQLIRTLLEFYIFINKDKKMSEAKTYETSDLYLTAFLKLKGQKFIVEKVNKKVIFKFTDNEVLGKLVSDYLTESGSCEPLLYSNSIKNLKNLIYNI